MRHSSHSMTTTKPLTTGELMAALAQVPSYTPVRCYVRLTRYDDDDSDDDGYTDFHGAASVTGVHTALNEVVLEVEE